MKNTKYSNLTYEEYRKIKNDKYKDWINKQDDEKIKKYKDKMKGFCDICKKDCSNIYSHNKSASHMKKLHIENTEA
jgi:hypothetical protein